jgi:hypothetical protein
MWIQGFFKITGPQIARAMQTKKLVYGNCYETHQQLPIPDIAHGQGQSYMQDDAVSKQASTRHCFWQLNLRDETRPRGPLRHARTQCRYFHSSQRQTKRYLVYRHTDVTQTPRGIRFHCPASAKFVLLSHSITLRISLCTEVPCHSHGGYWSYELNQLNDYIALWNNWRTSFTVVKCQ